ncbi:MAG: methylmalonyl-CoA mutase, partial [Roseiarcus sp.]
AGAADAREAAARFSTSGAAMACLCGSDEAYGECAEGFAAALKKAGARHLVLAGKAGANEAAWRAAGVDDFIFVGGDALAALQRSFRRLGVTF